MHVKLGIAPIGWTNDDLPELGGEIPFEQCVSEMALAGYEGCEVGNKYPKDPALLRAALDLRGLQICNQWFSYTLTTEPLAEVQEKFARQLDFLEAVGAGIVGGGETGTSIQGMPKPVLDHKVHLDATQWRQLTDGLNTLGKMAADRGIKLAFHHHMGTGVQSMEETDRLLNDTDPDYVFLNYDCGHFYFAGEDPVAALGKYIGRTAHVHLKDVREHVLSKVKKDHMSFLQAVKAGVFTVPGDPEGSIDFKTIFKLLNEHNYTGWIVVEAEQDPARANPLEYSMMGNRFIRYHLMAAGL
jgi:inosose dehydratase